MGAKKRLRVALVVVGFPTPDRPAGGIFNLRAARALAQVADIIVLHLRAWMPGRRRVAISERDGLKTVTITAPQVPGLLRHNLVIYRRFAWPHARTFLSECDLVHSVGANFAGVIGSWWSAVVGIHHVTNVTGSDLNTIMPRIYRNAGVAGWERHLQGVACNSDDLKRRFMDLFPAARNVRTIRRGVDLALFHPHGSMAGPFANRPPVRFLFLGGFPGSNSNLKGGETLLEAWQLAERELAASGACLLIAGPNSGPATAQRWRARLRFPDQVVFAGSIIPESIPAYLRASEVVLLPSLQEGLPNVAVEAAACGRAVFASRVGGLPEVVVHGETGLLLSPQDIEAWRLALVSYAGRTADLQSMGQRARRRVESSFDALRFPFEMVNLYHAALQEPLAGGSAAVPCLQMLGGSNSCEQPTNR
jgi:glycosyltransferase involved in cell wall biosynthesis